MEVATGENSFKNVDSEKKRAEQEMESRKHPRFIRGTGFRWRFQASANEGERKRECGEVRREERDISEERHWLPEQGGYGSRAQMGSLPIENGATCSLKVELRRCDFNFMC